MNHTMVVLSLFLALALGVAGCGRGSEAEMAGTLEPRDLAVDTASTRPTEAVIRVSGSVEAWVHTSPGTKLLGRVAQVPAELGDRVAEGDLLARLEDADLRAAVAQAEAAVAMADAGRENADAHYRRMVDLHGRGSVTDKNLEDAQAGMRVSEASLQQAKAALTVARVTLSYAEIRAPLSGWVVARRIEVGDMAAPGAPLFSLEDLSRVKIVVQVPEGQVRLLAVGAPATVEVDVLERELAGTIHRIIPSGDPSSRTYEVQVALDNPGGALNSGMFVRARFPQGTVDALRIPRTAIVRRGQLDGLFIVDEAGIARLRWVRVGREEDGQVLILSGLQDGERYVVDPPSDLVDRTPVREG